MTNTTSSSAYHNLKDIIFSLGMEITDSILLSLQNGIADCRQENVDRLAVVDPVLLGMEAVVNHIDAVRDLSDPGAFRLLNDLLSVYKKITDDGLDAEQTQQTVSAALKQVFSWQHLCMLQPKREAVREPVQEWESSTEPVDEPVVTTEFDLQAILHVVQQEVAETRRIAAQESAILRDLTRDKKGVADERPFPAALKDEEAAPLLSARFDALHETFQEEMIKLRWDLGITRSAE